MAKFKEQDDEEKIDDLEIISVGSLYDGPLEKKYWSSSRGKDRYPYPRDYEAVRTYGGSTYKMEIHDGPKGPVFLISSADGHSCSGHTPNMAWGKFQKTCCSNLKVAHGKRSSCKIDGVEFFGFKNPFVQRLLRELLANMNGLAEQNLSSSGLCNETSGMEHDSRYSDSCRAHDVKPYETQSQTGKKRTAIKNTKFLGRVGSKRLRPQDLSLDMEVPNLEPKIQRNHEQGGSMSSLASKEGSDPCKPLTAYPEKMHSTSEVLEENDHVSCSNGFLLKSVDLSDHLKEAGVQESSNELPSVEIYKSSAIAASQLAEELDRSEGGENKDCPITDKISDGLLTEAYSSMHEVNLCAPDTLDSVEDDTTSAASTQNRSITHNLKDGLKGADMVIVEGLIAEPHLEGPLKTNSNVSFQKGEIALADHDFAKSMMSFLLPQAIPLLKKSPRKEQTSNSSEIVSSQVQSQEENNEANIIVNTQSPAMMLIEKACVKWNKEMQIVDIDCDSVIPSCEHNKSVALDSFDEYRCDDHLIEHTILSSPTERASLGSLDKETCSFHIQDQLVSVDMQKSSVSKVDACESKCILSYDGQPMVLNKRVKEGDLFKEDSPLGFVSPRKSEEFQDDCATLDANCVNVENHIVEKDLNYAPDSVEGDSIPSSGSSSLQASQMDVNDGKVLSEIGVSTGAPKVYARRKKVVNKVHREEKCSGPHYQVDINCNNKCVSTTFPTTGTMFVSEANSVSSFAEKQQKKDLLCAEIRFETPKDSFNAVKTDIGTELALNETGTVTVQRQALAHASKAKSVLTSFDNSVSNVESFPVRFDKEMLVEENIIVPVISQGVGTTSCDIAKSNAREVFASSDLNIPGDLELNGELEGIVELVGCYVHPMPISSVLLESTENEVYFCVSCGVNKERTLFIYKIEIKEQRVGDPSFIGQTSVKLPFLKDEFGREFAIERSGIQFTPEGQYLVLLDNIRTPYCREGRLDCTCSTCTSNYFQENVVKIVKVKSGHVSVVTKLKTDDRVKCILVCYPNYLIAVGESGRLYLWIMNSTWSAQAEKYVIPVNQCISPYIVELKKVPNCAHLVVGHNGFGEFCLWNISRRATVSRYTAQSASIDQFYPVSLFSWHPVSSHSALKGQIDRIMDATTSDLVGHSYDHPLLPIEGNDVAVWIIVSTVADSDAQQEYASTHSQTRCWRLALLVKDMVICGSALDASAATVGASFGRGIIGTQDGLAYMWELSTGTKLGTLHDFKGRSISCITTDSSRSGIIGIASDDGQLLVYRDSQRDVASNVLNTVF